MIGDKIIGKDTTYTITQRVTTDVRPNANIYLCEDTSGNKYIAKHFYNQAPMANIALGRHNHYGRRRDGSAWVFGEIHEKNKHYDFLVKHVERIRYNCKWIIILEFIEGEPLSKFIRATHNTNLSKVDEAVKIFTEVLVKWHTNNFAHGDPHLDNVMIDPVAMKVVLIDYSQIHHPDFWYCQEYGCYDPDPQRRFKHDLDNYTHKLGDGFRTCLTYLDDELNLGTRLTDIFDKHYTIVLQ
jgi:RIO-like serine/threonine protein kinase